jgi:hypothetical protein
MMSCSPTKKEGKSFEHEMQMQAFNLLQGDLLQGVLIYRENRLVRRLEGPFLSVDSCHQIN